MGYYKTTTALRAKYTSKDAKYEQRAKEAWKHEEILSFANMKLENLISFAKDVESQSGSIGKLINKILR